MKFNSNHVSPLEPDRISNGTDGKSIRSWHSPFAASRWRSASVAFTRTDLLVVVGVGMLLSLVTLPSVAASRVRADLAFCLGNFRQLGRAWMLYTEDNNGLLPGNLNGGLGQDPKNRKLAWATGWLDFSGTDNTNTANLRDAQLGRYVESISIFRCPSDPSLHRGKTGVPRVRSISMNCYMGEQSSPYTSGYRLFHKLADISAPSPAKAFVFIEEHEGSINDPWYAVSMDGYEPEQPSAQTFVNIPADWHEGSCSLGFADGHVEDWRWLDPRTRPPHRLGGQLSLGTSHPGNVDLRRIQAAATSRAF